MASNIIKTILLVTTHFTLLILIISGAFMNTKLNIPILILLLGIESALLGKNVLNQIQGQVIRISFEGSNGQQQSKNDER